MSNLDYPDFSIIHFSFFSGLKTIYLVAIFIFNYPNCIFQCVLSSSYLEPK